MKPSHQPKSRSRTVHPQRTKALAVPAVTEHPAAVQARPLNTALIEKWRFKFGLHLRRPRIGIAERPHPD